MLRKTVTMMLCLAAPGLAHALDCSVPVKAQPLQPLPTVLSPLSPELSSPSYQLGAQSGVLAHAYDESQAVDQVLLRLRIEGCRNVASAMPAPSVIDPNDPAAYKPKTEFDNTPWRFDMNQNGKRMTADEFDAWMKSRGVRVARGAAPAAVPAAATVPAADGTAPAPAAAPAQAPAEAPKPAEAAAKSD